MQTQQKTNSQSNKLILATVNINIGKGQLNPVLIIRQNDDISSLVNSLIAKYSLPKKVYSIIISKVQEQLGKENIQLNRINPDQKSTHSITKLNKSSISPIKNNVAPTSTFRKKQPVFQKTYDKIHANKFQQKSTCSPLRKNDLSSKKPKVQIRTSRSPITKKKQFCVTPNKTPSKSPVNNIKKKSSVEQNLRNLFANLTKANPPNLKILCPQYINLKGLNKGLLTDLQDLFERIEEKDFDLMTETYFLKKVRQFNLQSRLGKEDN